MDQSECVRVQAYLRVLLGAPGIVVRAESAQAAAVMMGEEKVAKLDRDEDEGELSYTVSMGLPRAPGAAKNAPLDASERARLEKHLHQVLGAPALNVRARPRKTDSAELFAGDEFVGVVSADDKARDVGYYLTLSILDIDLDEGA